MEGVYTQAEEFFKRDNDYKIQSFEKELNGQRGFVPGEIAKGSRWKDRKEYYHVGRDTAYPSNVWPDQRDFKETLSFLYHELDRYVVPLQQAILSTINMHCNEQVDLNFLNNMTEKGDTLLRALYYPALTELEENLRNGCWAAAHTDIYLLAILPYATVKGLQVEVDGQWLNVIVPENAFIVNIGDMLENISNGLFVSAKHRVIAQETNIYSFHLKGPKCKLI